MGRIQDIPGNDHALDKLCELVKSGDAIAFVGAGASAGLYPLWNALIRHLADEAVSRGRAEAEERRYWLKTMQRSPQRVVSGIKECLGHQIYGDILRKTFSPRTGPKGKSFTPVHEILLRMPFRGYVTTNYDPGLIEARRELRQDASATGFATWKDVDGVTRWLTGDIFREEACPILFAHGIYDRSDTVVLGTDDYREAYLSSGPYRRLFEKLWGQDRLVFVGFGFSDAWLDFVADEVISQTAGQAAGDPRHIAIVGLPENEPYTSYMRQDFQNTYNADVVFYPVTTTETGQEDHAAILPVFDAIKVEETAIGAPSITESPGVYFADVVGSLQSTRDRIINELKEKGIHVDCHLSGPDGERPDRDAVIEKLTKANLSIYLLEPSPDRRIHDEPDRCDTQEQQVELGMKHAHWQLIWAPPDLNIEKDIVDGDYKRFMNQLVRGTRNETHYNFVRCTPGELTNEIVNKLNQLTAVPPAPPVDQAVLLDTHRDDQIFALKLASYLAQKGIQFHFLPEVSDRRVYQASYEGLLKEVKALIIFFGQVEEEWVKERITVALQFAARQLLEHQQTTLDACCIYLLPPRNPNDLPPLPGGVFQVHILDNSRKENLDPGVIDPILSGLCTGGGP